MNNPYYSAAQAVGFYDTPFYKEGEDKPLYYNLFSWTPSHFYKDKLEGELDETRFDTLEKKIWYLQGVFNDYSGSAIQQGNNTIHFANSSKKVERCKNWLNEIAKEKVHGIFGQGVINHLIEYFCPVCHTVTINSDLIKYIKEYV